MPKLACPTVQQWKEKIVTDHEIAAFTQGLNTTIFNIAEDLLCFWRKTDFPVTKAFNKKHNSEAADFWWNAENEALET